MRDEFVMQLFIYFGIGFVVFLIGVAIVRLIFNIPTFLRYQKAQIKLLEQLAKTRGVDEKTVHGIISESIEWDSMKQ